MKQAADQLPPGATDCHQHIFGPYTRFPLAAARGYTPEEALPDAYLTIARQLGLQRFVVVQPSVFGTDNRCSLDAAIALGLDHTRVVAAIDEQFDLPALRALHEAGVRAVRVNVVAVDPSLPDRLLRVAAQIAPLGWHLELYTRSENLPAIAARMADLPVKLVLDHMGAVPAERGVEHPEFQAALSILAAGGWVKLCGYSISAGPPFDDLIAPARALLSAAPERCVWGSNWPHPTPSGPRAIDDQAMVDLLAEWCDDTALLQRVLVDNPARLYGF
jgi:predicted TIM-barrel fold metal-dependent hydrolase